MTVSQLIPPLTTWWDDMKLWLHSCTFTHTILSLMGQIKVNPHPYQSLLSMVNLLFWFVVAKYMTMTFFIHVSFLLRQNLPSPRQKKTLQTFSIHVLNSIYVEWLLLSVLWYPQWFPFSTAFYQQELKDGHWGIKQDHLWPWLHSNLCADMTGQAMLICWVQLPCVCSLSSVGLIPGPYLPFHTCPYSVCTLYSQLESH